ncbi:MAG: fibronectin type III domain-containing protein, partial [Bacteroidales bacterium]|nr:fibronectin type III domain-containing protein [Bacteroidales bacterium]
MAGQSNMQGHAYAPQLKQILCAKEELELPGDPQGCYRTLPDHEERLFNTIRDFYEGHSSFDSDKARLEAGLINHNDLVDVRLDSPFDKVQVINFNYSRSDGVRNEPAIWSGPLKVGFGFRDDNDHYGPEMMFGHYLSQFTDDNIVLIKVVEGGTNLHVQWRSPSMEARLGVGDEPSNYPLLIQHLNEVLTDIGSLIPAYAGEVVETEVAGFVWFQGWNDGGSSTFANGYEQNLTDLINDLRSDIGISDLPVVIGQSHRGGDNGLIIQAAQQSVGDNLVNAGWIPTNDLSNYFHFDSGSQLVIGNRMGEKMKTLLGWDNSGVTMPNAPSNLQSTAYSTSQIQLSWTDNSDNEAGFKLERSQSSNTGFQEIATIGADVNSYQDANLDEVTTYYYRLLAFNDQGSSGYSATTSATTGASTVELPSPWVNSDIGNPQLMGSAVFSNDEYTVVGGGSDIWGSSDKFHFVYQSLTGDGEIIAKVESMTNTHGWAKAGVMIRSSLAANASHGMVVRNPGGATAFQRRVSNGGGSVNSQVNGANLKWVKINRTGDTLTAFTSANGSDWQVIDSEIVNIAADVYIGMAVTSHSSGKLCTALLSNVTVNVPVQIPVSPSALTAEATSSDSITLNWTDNSDNENGFKLERSLNPTTGFQEIATLDPGTTTYYDTGLETITTYYYRVLAYNDAGASEFSNVTSATTHVPHVVLPSPWVNDEIGIPDPSGEVSYNDGIYFITSGGEMWKKSDDFRFVYQPFAGDGEIVVRLNNIEGHDWARAGVMIRETLAPNSRYAMTMSNGGNRLGLQVRFTDGQATSFYGAPDVAQPWLKLERVGSVFTGYYSTDGTTWHTIQQVTIDMNEQVYVGLAVSNFNQSSLCVSEFSEVNVHNSDPVNVPQAPSSLLAVSNSAKSVTVSWSDNSDNEIGFKLERSLNATSGFQEIALLNANITTYNDTGLHANTTYFYQVLAYNDAGTSNSSNFASVTTDAPPVVLPSPWVNCDIGNPQLIGNATYDETVFTIAGGGSDIWDRSDKFHFVYQPLIGDGEISVKVESLTNTNIWAKAGVMIRSSLEANASHAMVIRTPAGLTDFQRRANNGDLTIGSQANSTSNEWVKLVRSGDVFTAYSSADGLSWEYIDDETIAMSNEVYVGMAVTSHNNTELCTALISNLSVSEGPGNQIPTSPTSLSATSLSSESIVLSWTDNSDNETGFKVERSLSPGAGFEEIADLGSNTESYQDEGLQASTTYYYRVLAYNDAGNSEYSDVHSVQTDSFIPNGELPYPWENADVGNPLTSGDAIYENGTFHIWGAGEKVSNKKDEFHFVYQSLPRNGEIITKVHHLSEMGDASKAGIMVRESLEGTGTRMIFVAATKSNDHVDFIARSRNRKSGGTHGGHSDYEEDFPVWLKLVKDGEFFTAHFKTEDDDWIEIYERIVPLDDEVYVGLFVNSNNINETSEATFSNITINHIATPGTPKDLEVSVNDMNTAVTLDWADYSKGENGFIIERSTKQDTGYEVIATVAANAQTYVDTDAPLTTCYYRIKAFDEAGESAYSNIAEIYVGTPLVPWKSIGVGHEYSTDTVVFRDGVFTITESGAGIEGNSDQFRYLFQDVLGDGEIIARLNEVTSTGSSAKTGLMIRETLNPNSKMVVVGLKGDGGELFSQKRATTGGNTTSQSKGTTETPRWLKLTRTANTITLYNSANGVTWTEVEQTSLTISDKAYFGLMASSEGENESVEGVFDEVVVNSFNTGERMLYLSRLAGDHDKSGVANTIHVEVTSDTVHRKNRYTGMQGKTIEVDLANKLSSDNTTISFKFIPDSLNQSVDLFTANNIVVHLDGDRVNATLASEEINSDMPISNIICNHVVIRFSRQEVGFYVNGQWQVIDNINSFDIDNFKLGSYKGQTWDIQVYNGLLTDSDVEVLSKLCLPSVDASEFSRWEEFPNCLCASYACVWGDDVTDLTEDRFSYFLWQLNKAYELYTFEAGMYPHDDLEGHVEGRYSRDTELDDVTIRIFVKNLTFDNHTYTRENANFFWHETFHAFQLYYGDRETVQSKWIAEASADWAADFVFPGMESSLLAYYTLFPHLPIYRTINSPLGDYPGQEFKGGSNYGAFVLFSYITNFISDDGFMGRLYNKRHDTDGEMNDITTIDYLLAQEGQDFCTIFGDFAARITVWDFED